MEDLNAQLNIWVWTVANERVHGTTHEQPVTRWATERERMHATGNRPPYPYAEDELRRVACDAYVSWQGSRYSVPWQYAGKEVWVCEHGGRVGDPGGRVGWRSWDSKGAPAQFGRLGASQPTWN